MKIGIVGAGPVGLTLASFLKKYRISYKMYEQNNDLRNHPSAHLINSLSMEIFSEIGISTEIRERCESLMNFRNYWYMWRIGEQYHF